MDNRERAREIVEALLTRLAADYHLEFSDTDAADAIADITTALDARLPDREPTELRERLAALCHEQWSRWMRYIFEKAQILDRETDFDTGREPNATRWQRQMNTPYTNLSDSEKESDRKEADSILAVLQSVKAWKEEQKQ